MSSPESSDHASTADKRKDEESKKERKHSFNPLAVSDVRREDILRHVFGDVGKLVDDFSCAVESTVLLHGRLYVTTRFLCFYSNLFGLEKKIRIPYSHISAVTKEKTALVIPNAIAISTIRKEYIFRSFWDRDECYRMLKEHIEDIGLKTRKERDAVDKEQSPVLRYTMKAEDGPFVGSGERSRPQNRESALAMMMDKGEDQSDTGDSPRQSTVTAGSVEDRAGFVPSMSGTRTEEISLDTGSINLKNDLTDGEGVDVTSAGTKGLEGSGDEGDDEIVEQTEWEAGNNPSIGGDTSQFSPDEVKDAVGRALLKIEVSKKLLRVNVSDFAKMFVADDAPYSWCEYHASVGDSQLSASPWSSMSAADMGNLGSGREIKFFKPVNLPGLKETRGVKLQKYQRYGSLGLIVHSSTRLEDVPAADTFTVEDVVTVRTLDSSELEDGYSVDQCVEVTVSFEVKFIKSTFLRYMIESNTVSEMTKWLQAWIKHVEDQANHRVVQTEHKLASIKKMLNTRGAADEDGGDTSSEEGEGNNENARDRRTSIKSLRNSVKATSKRLRRLSASVKGASNHAVGQIQEAFDSWQRVEGRRFFVFCFALLLILCSMMYWQMRHLQASMEYMHVRMALMTAELRELRER
jgi:hypothetical protein